MCINISHAVDSKKQMATIVQATIVHALQVGP